MTRIPLDFSNDLIELKLQPAEEDIGVPADGSVDVRNAIIKALDKSVALLYLDDDGVVEYLTTFTLNVVDDGLCGKFKSNIIDGIGLDCLILDADNNLLGYGLMQHGKQCIANFDVEGVVSLNGSGPMLCRTVLRIREI